MNRFLAPTLASICLLAAGYVYAGAPITAVGPASYQPATTEKSTPATLRAPDAAPAARIVLPAVTDAELAALKAQNASPTNGAAPGTSVKSSRLAVAFGRTVAAGSQTVALDRINWTKLADGTRVARIEISSPGAAATRLALQLPAVDPDVSVAFSGTGNTARVFGPMPANRIASDTEDFGQFWTPVLVGQTAVVEFSAPASAKFTGVVLSVARVSHQVVAPGELNQLSAKTLSDIGRALPCETDVKCVVPQSTAFVNQTKAIASMLFTEDDGTGYLCSGQLLNDSATDFVPYFFTANHCIDGATPARTLNTFWFFWASSCGSGTVNPGYVQQTAGSALLARSPDWDWSLVRLNAAPPAGTFFSAWRAEPIANGTGLIVLHHPAGDLQKFSQGSAAGYFPDSGYAGVTPATFLQMTYTTGETEGGSSGSAILSFNAGGGFYEVRGGLYNGANPTCPGPPPGYVDNYSRLDNMLPLMRDYLTPGSRSNTDPVTVVEFYNANLNHFFMSAAPGEINDLDTGVHPGWVRTGIRFLAYNYAAAGTNPVCRFYRTPAFGDSHFYSASPAECTATAQQHPIDWTYESPNVFYIFLPDTMTGACPANTRPLWRFFNNVTTNHRYTPEVKIRDELRGDPVTWTPEGYGNDAVIMCSPLGS